jgi:hypothetical protein
MLKQGLPGLDDSLNLVEEISHCQNPLALHALSDSTSLPTRATPAWLTTYWHEPQIVIYTVGAEGYDTILWEDSITAFPAISWITPPCSYGTADAFCMGGDGTGTVFFARRAARTYDSWLERLLG